MPVTALISPANLEDNVQIVDFLDLEGIDGSVREPRANRLLPVLVWVLNQHGVVILHISCDLLSEPLRPLECFIFWPEFHFGNGKSFPNRYCCKGNSLHLPWRPGSAGLSERNICRYIRWVCCSSCVRTYIVDLSSGQSYWKTHYNFSHRWRRISGFCVFIGQKEILKQWKL